MKKRNQLILIYSYKFLPSDISRFDLDFIAKEIPIFVVCHNSRELAGLKFLNRQIYFIGYSDFLMMNTSADRTVAWCFIDGFGLRDLLLSVYLRLSGLKILRHIAPGLPPEFLKANRIFKLNNLLSPRFIYLLVFRKLYSLVRKFEKVEYLVAGSFWCNEYKRRYSLVEHSISYDLNIQLFMLQKLENNLAARRYILFLDGAYGFSNDVMIFGKTLATSAEEFYAHISVMLKSIAAQLRCDVICVPHPKRRFTNEAFVGLEEFSQQLDDWHHLVSGCVAVVTVNSTALVTALVEDKPVILIDPKTKFPRYSDGARDQEHFKQWLGCCVVSAPSDQVVLSVDREKYQKYLRFFHLGGESNCLRLGKQILNKFSDLD